MNDGRGTVEAQAAQVLSQARRRLESSDWSEPRKEKGRAVLRGIAALAWLVGFRLKLAEIADLQALIETELGLPPGQPLKYKRNRNRTTTEAT
jgi:hypothetical protein